jgi:hypothetical protein
MNGRDRMSSTGTEDFASLIDFYPYRRRFRTYR